MKSAAPVNKHLANNGVMFLMRNTYLGNGGIF